MLAHTRKIVADCGVAASTTGSIKQKFSWKSLELDNVVKAKKIGMRGKSQCSTHLTADDVREIRTSELSGIEPAEKSASALRRFAAFASGGRGSTLNNGEYVAASSTDARSGSGIRHHQ